MGAAKKELSENEATLLAECEKKIETGKSYFVLMGLALATVRDQKLWVGAYTSWSDYCVRRWDWTADYATRLIRASSVAERLPNDVIAPVTAGQMKAFDGVHDPSTRERVWRAAVEAKQGRQPSSEDVHKELVKVSGYTRVRRLPNNVSRDFTKDLEVSSMRLIEFYSEAEIYQLISLVTAALAKRKAA